jgi:hypothetical protein
MMRYAASFRPQCFLPPACKCAPTLVAFVGRQNCTLANGALHRRNHNSAFSVMCSTESAAVAGKVLQDIPTGCRSSAEGTQSWILVLQSRALRHLRPHHWLLLWTSGWGGFSKSTTTQKQTGRSTGLLHSLYRVKTRTLLVSSNPVLLCYCLQPLCRASGCRGRGATDDHKRAGEIRAHRPTAGEAPRKQTHTACSKATLPVPCFSLNAASPTRQPRQKRAPLQNGVARSDKWWQDRQSSTTCIGVDAD